MTPSIPSGKNPYVGPQPFPPGQPLFGRDREVLEIKYLLTSERIVLLYSPSGAGKSSLVNAGLRGRLSQRFEVLGPTRVNSQHFDQVANRYVWSAISGIEGAAAPPDVTWQSYLAGKTWRKNPLFIFDQFEEILRVDPWDTQGKREFFEQLGQALRDPHIWALFVLREDFIAPLDPYAHLIPTNLYNRYRLDRLTIETAAEAIEKPTAETLRKFAPGVVKALAENLAKVKVPQMDGSTIEKIGDYVEPLQLQVVCFDFWGRMADDQLLIGPEDIGDAGDALSNYYTHCVEAAAANDKNAERRIRDWFNDKLITADGVRNQVRQGTDESGGLENALVRELVDTYLIRPEPRGNSVWYELSHDRLVDPILQSNRKWLSTNLIPVQQRAVDWLSAGKPDSLLLDDGEIADAESWAKDPKTVLLGHEKEFLQACRISQRDRQMAEDRIREAERFERMEAERLRMSEKLREAARFRKATYLAIGFAVIALSFAVLSFIRSEEANQASAEANEAKDRATAAAAEARAAEQRATVAEARAAEQRAAAAAAEATKQLKRAEVSEQEAFESASFSQVAEESSKEKAKQAISERLAAAAILYKETRPGFAALLSLEGVKAADTFDIRNALLSSFQAHLGLVLPRHHGAEVLSVAFSPDGKLLATASSVSANNSQSGAGGGQTSIAAVYLWDANNRQKPSEPLIGHTKVIKAIAFSPDGRFLASASEDKTVRIWSTEKRVMLHELKGHLGKVTSVAFSPDGNLLASAGTDETVLLWNPATGKPVGEALAGHVGAVLSVAFSPDSQLLASAGDDKTLRRWNVKDRKAEGEPLKGHTDKVNCVTFSSNGKLLASASADHTVLIWDLSTGKPVGDSLQGHRSAVLSVAFSPDGERLASASEDNTVRIWNVSDRQPVGEPLRGHASAVTGVMYNQDGTTLASASTDGTVRLLTVANHKSLGVQLARHTRPLRAVALSRDGKKIALAGSDGTVQVKAAVSGESPSKPLQGSSRSNLWSVTFSPDGKLLASASSDGKMRFWDADSEKPSGDPLPAHQNGVRSITFSPDSKLLASGGNDKTVRLWDTLTRRQIGDSLQGHQRDVTSVAFSPDGILLASASADQTIRLWDVKTRQQMGEPMSGAGGVIVGVAFSHDGKLLASAHFDGAVRLWDVAERKLLGGPLLGH